MAFFFAWKTLCMVRPTMKGNVMPETFCSAFLISCQTIASAFLFGSAAYAILSIAIDELFGKKEYVEDEDLI